LHLVGDRGRVGAATPLAENHGTRDAGQRLMRQHLPHADIGSGAGS
jgi:hypothetical protein